MKGFSETRGENGSQFTHRQQLSTPIAEFPDMVGLGPAEVAWSNALIEKGPGLLLAVARDLDALS